MNKETKELENNNLNSEEKKEFVLNYLNELYLQNKDLKAIDRCKNYIDHFANNFAYDQDFYNGYLNGKVEYKDTQEANEDRLYKLFSQGKGTCMQFAQALSLITTIDYDDKKEYVPFLFGYCKINKKGHEIGHAINILFIDEKTSFIVDLSSMIHARDGEYKQDASKFCLVPIEEYEKSLKKENVKIVSGSKKSKSRSVICYPLTGNIDACYNMLNKCADDINKNIHKCTIFNLDEIVERK